MKEKRDNIYIYLWEEFNTIYIGRTINPKSRHYQHKHRESEKTYQFSSEHHVEHPKMIIIENDLTIEEGVEREKYWINEYKENSSYNVLNITCGGQRGRCVSNLTDEEKKQRQKEYYQKNKERILAYGKLYNQNHREKRKIYDAKRYEKIKKPCKPLKTKEEKKIQQKMYYEAHKEELKEYKKAYRSQNKDKIKLYREINKEKIRNARRKYYEEHKEEALAYQKMYRKQITKSVVTNNKN